MTDAINVVLFATTLAPFAACAVRYGFRSRWRSSAVGRALMLLLGSICAVLVLALAGRLVGPDQPVVTVLRIATLAVVQVAGWQLYRQIVRYQRRRGATRKDR